MRSVQLLTDINLRDVVVKLRDVITSEGMKRNHGERGNYLLGFSCHNIVCRLANTKYFVSILRVINSIDLELHRFSEDISQVTEAGLQ